MSHRGVPLVERVLERLRELADLLDARARDTLEAHAIDAAIAAAQGLVTGDIARPSDVVARALARWLERTRYLGIDRVEHAA